MSAKQGWRADWAPAVDEGDHPLATLDGVELAGDRLRVLLGPTSRFGARYFAVLLDGGDAVLTGLHNSGPLPAYNWVEVAETKESVIGEDGVERLFALLFELLPLGGHLMVEYDSPQRAETARALAQAVPAVVTPLGAMLYRLGFGAYFKDWQIAEGGSEGPRKLQAYKPPTDDDALRWRRGAAQQIAAFLARHGPFPVVVSAARERAEDVLPELMTA